MLMKLCNSPLSLQLFHLVPVRFTGFPKQQRRLTPLDIIPTPNANLHGSQPIFTTSDEHRVSRQPLDYLDKELSRNQGQSSIVQRSKQELKAYLNADVITDL